MSYFRSVMKHREESVDPFEQLYQKSPVPKNLLFATDVTSSPLARKVPVTGFTNQKSQIFNQLKEQSHFNVNRSPLAVNITKGLLQNTKQPTNPEGFKKSENATLLSDGECNVVRKVVTKVTDYVDDEKCTNNTSWQNGTFSENLDDRNQVSVQDEVDGMVDDNASSIIENQNHAWTSQDTDKLKELTTVCRSQSEVLVDKSLNNTLLTTSQSAASIFKKIKTSKNVLLPGQTDVMFDENGENRKPTMTNIDRAVNESSKDVLYPTDNHVCVEGGIVAENETSNNNRTERTDRIGVLQRKTEEQIDPRSYKLYNWIIKPLPEVQSICVEGKKNKNDEQFYHSSIVTSRVNNRTVRTANGSKYTLVGNIETLDALDAGITEDVVKAFNNGFPARWKTVISDFFRRVKFVDEKIEVQSAEDATDNSADERLSQMTSDDLESVTETIEDISEDTLRPSPDNGKKGKDYTLADWIIKPIGNTEEICVEGKKSDADVGTDEYWHSTSIDHILDKKTVVTCSGSIYRLQGKMSKLDALEAGFTEKIVKSFADGFPRNWKSIIKAHFSILKRPKTEEVYLTPKAQQNGKKHSSSTVCTPNGMMYELDCMKKTRSGRVVRPALAWWAGQKVKANSDNTFELSYNSSKTPEILREMSESYKCVTPRYHSYLNTSTASYKINNSTVLDKSGKTISENNVNSEKNHKKSNDTRNSLEMDRKKEKRKSSEKRMSEKYERTEKSHSKNKQSSTSLSNNNKVLNKQKRVSSSKSRSKEIDAIDNLVEDLTSSVTNKSYKKKTVASRKNTCYHRNSSSKHKNENKSSAEETYSVDMDSDFEEDEVQNKKKSKSKVRKTRSTEKQRGDSNNKSSTANKRQSLENRSSKKEEVQDWSKLRPLRPRTQTNNKGIDKNTEQLNKRKDSLRKKQASSKNQPNRKKQQNVSSDEESSDEDDFSEKTGTVKAKRTQSRVNMPLEKEPVIVQDLPWTKQEITKLNRAIAYVPGDDPSFWEIVAQKVSTRTSEECVACYYKDISKSTNKKHPVNAVKKNDFKGITAKKGTLKRKQQLRDFVEHHNEGYEDDLFDSTPYRKQGSVKIPKLMDDSDGDIFEEMSKKHPHLLNRIYTPLTRVHVEPISEKKTPGTSLESPWTNVDRKEAEHYIHQIQKRRHMKGRKILDKAKTPVNKKPKPKSSPTKSLFGKLDDAQNLFVADGSSSENHEDTDTEKDYYWSDMEN